MPRKPDHSKISIQNYLNHRPVSAINPDPQHWRERLSDYLDDRLAPAERAEFEQAIRDDDQSESDGLRGQLDQMSQQRDSLKRLADHDSRFQLDSGFADRVLESSMKRAMEKLSKGQLSRGQFSSVQGVGDDHPLILLAKKSGLMDSVTVPNHRTRLVDRRMLVAVIGIAASLGLLVFSANRFTGDDDSVSEQPFVIAQNQTSISEAPERVQSLIELDSISPKSSDVGLASVEGLSSAATQEDEVEFETMTNPTLPVGPAFATSSDRRKTKSVASSVMDSTVSMGQGAIGKGLSPTKLAAIMVLEVRQTESGRVVGAVRRAMKNAGIGSSDERSLTAEIAESASQTVALGDDEFVSMLYLQASAKSIDQFYVNLFDDQSGVASVSLAIASNTPVLGLVDAVEVVDATSISHGGGLATRLTGEIDPINDLNFSQVSRESMRGMTQSSGPDFAAQLIIVIR